MTKKEIAEVKREAKFWKRFERIFRWKLVGWTYKKRAQFSRQDGSYIQIGGHGNLLVQELEEILAMSDE